MSWMILLMDRKKLGKGCRDCRFLNDMNVKAECIVDERVDVYDNNGIRKYRPYECPFRYYVDHVDSITKRFEGMTEEETAGWFKGADSQARKYAELETERNNLLSYLQMKQENESEK